MDSPVEADEAGTSEAELQKFLSRKEPAVESPQEMRTSESIVAPVSSPAAPGSSAAGLGLGKSVEEQVRLKKGSRCNKSGVGLLLRLRLDICGRRSLDACYLST